MNKDKLIILLINLIDLRDCWVVYKNEDIEEPMTRDAVKSTGHAEIWI